MMMMWIPAVLLLMIVDVRAGLNSEGILEKALFTNYSKNVRPVSDYHEQLEVHLTYNLGKIEQLNEKKQQMVSFGWLIQLWVDQGLTWNPSDYDDIMLLIVPAESIWKPEMAVLNSMENLEDQSFLDDSRVRVLPSGEVIWIHGLRWVTECTMDLTFFPFDKQSCNVTFISWVHTTELVNYVNGDANASTDGFAPNGEWTLLSTSTFTAKLVEGDGDSFPLVGFILNLQRIPTYYIYNIVLPVGMLMVLSVVAHILPFEAGEKIGLQITILLAFSVMLLIMSDNTPRAGTTTPLVTIYICSIMCELTVSLIITACLLNLYYHRPDVPPPAWLQRLAHDFLKLLLCVRCHVRPPNSRRNGDRRHAKSPPSDGQSYSLYGPRVNTPVPYPVSLPEYVRNYLFKKIDDDRESAILERNAEEWQVIARILDRMFFVFFTIFIIVLTAVVFEKIEF